MSIAREMMTANPVTCFETDPVYRAVEIMKREDTGVVPIVDSGNRCRGIVTDRDLCLDVILQDMDPRSTQLRNVMHSDLVTCSPDEDLKSILNKMKGRQVKRILVVDNDHCVGIISEADIARHESKHVVGELAEGVYS